MLMCEEPLHEKDFFYKLRSLLDYIEILFAQDVKSTSEGWRCMKKNIQDMLSYDYVTVIRHQKQRTPVESGPPVELGSQQMSRTPSLTLLADMRAQSSNVSQVSRSYYKFDINERLLIYISTIDDFETQLMILRHLNITISNV
jgi:hypothetical protein